MENQAQCLFCHQTIVPMKDWNKRCPACREKQKKADEEEQERQRITLARRLPAAVINPEEGGEVFVDKFGKEVDNPGYDLVNDPRGWAYTGTKPKVRKAIV